MNQPPAADGNLAPTVLDAVALARLAELDPGGKAGIVRRVMATFDQSLVTTLVKLEQAERNRDVTELRRLAHTLKSSSASVGALALSAACAEVESMAREQRTAELPPALAALQREGRRAQLAVRALLAQ